LCENIDGETEINISKSIDLEGRRQASTQVILTMTMRKHLVVAIFLKKHKMQNNS
jgi:hypothetical protein